MTRLAFRLPPELASEILRALLSELERRALASSLRQLGARCEQAAKDLTERTGT